MKVQWHRWPQEKPSEMGEYWTIEVISRRIVKQGYWLHRAVYADRYGTWWRADEEATSNVIAWAEIDYPDLPELQVKLRTNGLPKSVEWMEAAQLVERLVRG